MLSKCSSKPKWRISDFKKANKDEVLLGTKGYCEFLGNMKYYKIEIKRLHETQEQVIGHANGANILDGKRYFERINEGELLEETPIFDSFFLQSYGPKEEWEWKLQDVHSFIGSSSPSGSFWFVSDKCRRVLEVFNIAKDYKFYESRLLYKGEKLKYWIFQFAVNPLQNFDFVESEYSIEGTDSIIDSIKSKQEYEKYDLELWNSQKKGITWIKTVFNNNFDFVININGDNLCSERYKQAIESAGLEGFLFSELDYEVSVQKFFING